MWTGAARGARWGGLRAIIGVREPPGEGPATARLLPARTVPGNLAPDRRDRTPLGLLTRGFTPFRAEGLALSHPPYDNLTRFYYGGSRKAGVREPLGRPQAPPAGLRAHA